MAKNKRVPRRLEDKTVPQLIKRLDTVFAKYVKRYWSLDGMYVKCYTCGKQLTLGERNTQAGHFISRSYSATRFDEDNVRPQCGSPCNDKRYGNGMPIEFEANLRNEIGEAKVESLKEKARANHKWDRAWLIEKIKHYDQRVAEIN